MLRWCAYCQEFQGEVAPLDTYATTHGICPVCKAKGIGRLDTEIGNSHRVRDIQELLYEAGKTGEVAAASSIVHRAFEAGLRPVDILVGIITPLLYRIGAEWESHEITVADEHRFTSFCERVFELVKLEAITAGAPNQGDCHAQVFLTNARGNSHTLGIRIVALWLQSKGIETREFDPPPSAEALVELVAEIRPQAILISLALDRQKSYVWAIAQRLEALQHPRPTLIVGGYAIKQKLVSPIPGALFFETITGLDDFIWTLK